MSRRVTLSAEQVEAVCEARRESRGARVAEQLSITFADPGLNEQEKPRLAGQCLKIFTRLQSGTATNKELAEIALKYTSRISDLRKSGIGIRVIERDHETGLVRYALESQEPTQ